MSTDDDFAPLPPKPKSWNELFAITEGLKTVPIEEIDRGRVDWEYEFDSKDMRPCGRKSCERKHAHGWLVALQGRRFVHIGNDCAEKYAHVEKWRANIIGYEARIAASARITATLEAREEAQRKQYWLDTTPEIQSAIALHESFAREAGGPVIREIEKRAERGKPAIEREYRLTPEEMESRRAMLSVNVRGDGRTVSSHVSSVETRVVGEIAGLECFRSAGKPGDLHRQLQRLVISDALLDHGVEPDNSFKRRRFAERLNSDIRQDKGIGEHIRFKRICSLRPSRLLGGLASGGSYAQVVVFVCFGSCCFRL